MHRQIFALLTAVLLLIAGTQRAGAQFNPTNPGDPPGGGTTGGGGTTVTSYYFSVKANPAGACTNIYPASGNRTFGTQLNPYFSGVKAGYRFVNWTNSAGEVVSVIGDFYYYMPEHDETLTANFEYTFDPTNPGDPTGGTTGGGGGTTQTSYYFSVKANPAGACTSIYPSSGNRTVGSQINPYFSGVNQGYKFVNWTNSAGEVVSSIGDFYYYMPSHDETLTANFDYTFSPTNPGDPTGGSTGGGGNGGGSTAAKYNLTVKTNPAGVCTNLYPASGSREEGARVNPYYTGLNSNYRFVNWTNSAGEVISTVSDFYYYMPGHDETITANFEFYPVNPGDPAGGTVGNPLGSDKVFGPRFSLDKNNVVTIFCQTPAATIYYTTDGSEPTTASTLYTEPFAIDANTMVRAMATKEGMKASQITFYQIMPQRCEPPKIEFISGRRLQMSCPTPNAVIYYTTDLSVPDAAEGVGIKYDGTPITLSDNRRIMAVAIAPGFGQSEVLEYSHRTVEHQTATPVIKFDETTNNATITCETPDASIHYTLDGSQPTEGSEPSKSGVTFKITQNCTIKAMAVSTDLYESFVSEYAVKLGTVRTPSVTFKNRTFAIATESKNATIYYTLDGTTPSRENGTKYSAPFLPASDCRIKAVACVEGYDDSDVAEFQYRRVNHTVATPRFSRANDKLTLTCANADSKIYWIEGAKAPIGEDFKPVEGATLYTEPISLSKNCVITARAMKENMLLSDSVSFDVTGFVAVKPVISFEGRKVVISNGMTGHEGVIRFTIDGAMPTDSVGAVYSKPFLPTADCTVKAVFFTGSFNPSEVTEYVYRKAEHTVAKPQFSRKGNKIAITSATQGAQIFWGKGAEIAKAMPVVTAYETAVKTGADFDYEAAKSTLETVAHIYTDSVDVVSNETYAAIALAENMLIDFNTYEVSDMVAVKPVISFEGRKVEISNGMTGHEGVIRYTIDGSVPSDSASVYSKPFLPTADCTVKAVFFTDSFNPSAVTEYVYRKAEHTVAKPQFSRKGNKIAITSETQGAQIFWGKGAEIAKAMPVVNEYETAVKTGADFDYEAAKATLATVAHVYTDSVDVLSNEKYAAIALAENMLIDYATYEVSDMVAVQPVISFQNRRVVISNGMTGHEGVIRYTIDGAVPTDSASVYSKPFLPTVDCTVKAVFFTDSFNPSAVTEYVYRKAEHTVAKPQFSRKGNKIAITSATQGAQIFWGKGAEIAKAMPVVTEYENAVKTGADFDYEAAKATLATVAHVYTDSVDVLSNEKYAAIALAENMLIDYATYEVGDMVAVQPVISFENRKVVISNGMTGHSGVIRYTIDGTVPSDSVGAVYSKPFLPTADCTVKAVFFTDSFNPSAVTEYVYRKAEHTVAKPQFSRKGNKIAITSETQGAQIFWGKGVEIAKAMPVVNEYETAVKTGADFDYEAAKATLATVAHVYTDSVDVLSNEKYAAIALAENMLINYNTYEVSDMVAVQPVISFENRKVVISNGMTGHEGVIRYTIDGLVPTDSVGAVYSKPFLPTADCTVKAVFFTDSFNPSAVTEYVYKKAEHTVAKPQFSRKGNKIAITSATQGAQIFWGKGAEIAKAMPVVNEYETAVKTGADFDYAGAIVRLDSVAHVYTDSIALVENSMFAAIALADNMLIDYATFEVTDFTCPGVEIGFARKAVWIKPTSAEEGAKIMFKLYSATDSAQVIQAAREYTEPFLPATDCVVEAWMRKSNFNDSDSTRYAFVGAEHTLPVMSFTADFKAGTATLSAPEGETVGIGEAVSLKVNGIEVVSVTEGESVGQREVNLSRVLADQGRLAGSVEGTWTSIDRLENNPLLININKAKTPIVSHDGRMVSVESPQTTVIYSIAKDKGGADEGESSVEDSLTLPLADTGLMTCKAWNDSLLLSDEASIEIAAFHDGVHTATVRKAGALKDAFGWLQGETLSVEELTVTGPGRVEAINSDDLATLGGFTNLRRLNLENTAADESAGVFNAGGFAGLVEISLPKSGATAWNLAENTLLCAVHWNDSTKMNTGLANPNAVVFARELGLVAEGVNCVVGGASQRFVLTDGYPFYTPESFTAVSASYVKRFSKRTTPGESRGWETIVLPFGVDKVTHLDKGREIAAFGDSDAAKKDMRRFWLAEAGNGGFKSASRIAANQPYLIAMPNSKEYLDDWNISGEIEFAATNATVSSELPARVAFGSDTREFTGTYFPLAASASRYALVAEADGDCFAAEKSAVKPMECYFEGQAGMMRIPIGSGESYLSPIATDDIEFRVFSEGGRVIVISPRDAQVGVYNIAGMLVKLLDITANEPATVDSLEHGIYIIANKKIIF